MLDSIEERIIYYDTNDMREVERFRQLRGYIEKKIPEIVQQKKTLFIPFKNSNDVPVIILGVYVERRYKLRVKYNKDGIFIYPTQSVGTNSNI